MDIVSLPLEIEASGIDSRYRLVVMAIQHAKHIAEGAKPQVDSPYRRVSMQALCDVLYGQFDILYGQEAKEAQREESRRRAARWTQTRPSERELEIAEAIRRDIDNYRAMAVQQSDVVQDES